MQSHLWTFHEPWATQRKSRFAPWLLISCIFLSQSDIGNCISDLDQRNWKYFVGFFYKKSSISQDWHSIFSAMQMRWTADPVLRVCVFLCRKVEKPSSDITKNCIHLANDRLLHSLGYTTYLLYQFPLIQMRNLSVRRRSKEQVTPRAESFNLKSTLIYSESSINCIKHIICRLSQLLLPSSEVMPSMMKNTPATSGPVAIAN